MTGMFFRSVKPCQNRSHFSDLLVPITDSGNSVGRSIKSIGVSEKKSFVKDGWLSDSHVRYMYLVETRPITRGLMDGYETGRQWRVSDRQNNNTINRPEIQMKWFYSKLAIGGHIWTRRGRESTDGITSPLKQYWRVLTSWATCVC